MDKNVNLAERCAAKNQSLRVGYYVFSSGVVSPDKNADAEICGVIGWVNKIPNAPVGNRALVVTLKRVKAAWSDCHIALNMTTEEDGQTNTKRILEELPKVKMTVPAVQYCVDYAENGIKAGEGFLPSKEQLMLVAKHYGTVNNALENIQAQRLSGIYLSSTEYNKDRIWEVKMEKMQPQVYAKSYGGDYVRCFVAL